MKDLVHTKNNLIDYDSNMHFILNSLMNINNIKAHSYNISLIKSNLKLYGIEKKYPFNNGNGTTCLILFSAVARKMKKFDEFD